MKIRDLFPLALLLFLLMAMGACQQTPTKREISPQFCHHVFFWLNNPNDTNEREAFTKGITELLEMQEIKAYHVGTPANTGDRNVVDDSYTYSFMVFFENEIDHEIYQDHPLHLKFINDCSHLWNKVVVYDSVTE